ncbi:MAG: hypothetical protein O9318_00305 [Hylemonella sp.]|uniref:hypothetical protein n=1 Tax=Hylemonella sp. TaxID=2066020 RepID=UPI0022CCE0F2|nr:hypothetical protein [Hylemonella sp.]MCZ8250888.1 hypothetical protein [Hylemonella sp.]
MQSHYPETFERDMACTEAEWLAWLPAALGDCPYQQGSGEVQVQIGSGALQLQWQALPPRTIALMRLPRLAVRFVFRGVPDAERTAFMRRFDLYTQRGGG